MKVEEFAQTPEAQEYLDKLQTGKIQLPEDASAVEKDVLSNMMSGGKRMRSITTTRNDIKDQLKVMEAQLNGVEKEITALNGEMSAYAKLLLASENERRNMAEGPQGAKTSSTPVKEVELDMKPAPARRKKREVNAVGEN